MAKRLTDLVAMCRDAVAFAPALASRISAAGLTVDDLGSFEGLNRLPVLKKERLLELQEADPPFAGFLGCDLSEVAHVFASPGPIFEPLAATDETGHGMATVFREAGIGRGDVALNTWAYHLVPAGLLFDRGLRHCDAMVIPSGPGNTELQVRMIDSLGVTAFLGSTAYFQKVAETFFKKRDVARGWKLRNVFLGGEFGDWDAKRRRLEERYGVRIWSCYATADLGLVGYEQARLPGYAIPRERLVQICDPETGTPVARGESGEIVVSTLSRGWPMIRFGTGDLAHALAMDASGFVSRLSPLEGRTGDAVKVREIFVYPRHIQALADAFSGLDEVRAKVTRDGGREAIALELRCSGARPDRADMEAEFRRLTRLRPDHVEFVGNFTIDRQLQDLKDA